MIRSRSKTKGQHNGVSAGSATALHERPASRRGTAKRLVVAHILLAHNDLASRLTIETLLKGGGYSVDSVASGSEAMDRLEKGEYQLVLADLRAESEDAGQKVLAYDRQKSYRPATALVTSFLSAARLGKATAEHHIAVDNEDVSRFLDGVAELIGMRVSRRVNRRIAKAR